MIFKPYAAYKPARDARLGQIPSHWTEASLKRAVIFAYGDSLPDEKRMAGDVPVFGSNGQVGSHNVANTLSPAIIIGRKGSFGAVNYSDVSGFAIDTTYFVDSRYTTHDIRWLYYLLTASGLSEVSQDTGVPGLSREVAYNRQVAIPPRPEQHAIADFLDRETAKIAVLIAKQEELIERIEEKRIATITQSVTGASAESLSYDTGIRWIGSIPRHWKVMKLRHLTRQIVDGAHFTPTYVDEGVPFLRVTDIHKSCIDWRDVKRIPFEEHIELTKRCKPQRGDVLLSKNGTIGVPFVVSFDEDFSIFVSLCLLKLNPNLNPNFLAYFIMSNSFKEQISHGIKQSTVTNLHLDKIAQFDIVVPPVDEQSSICSRLKDELEEIEALSAKSIQFRQTLIEHRSALITAAVTGQIEVAAKIAAEAAA